MTGAKVFFRHIINRIYRIIEVGVGERNAKVQLSYPLILLIL